MKIIFMFICIIFIVYFANADNTASFLDFYPTSLGEGTAGNVFGYPYKNYSLFFYNPARLSKDNILNISYEHKFLLNNISNYNSLFLDLPVIYNMEIALGYINQNISNIPIFGEIPLDDDSISFEPLGMYNDMANAFLFNISYTYKPHAYSPYDFSAGLNIKFIYHTIHEYTGMGSGMDFAVLLRTALHRLNPSVKGYISVFAGFDDIYKTRITWDTESSHYDIRKTTIKTGINYNVDINSINSNIHFEANYRRKDSNILGLSFIYCYNDLIGIYSGVNFNDETGKFVYEDQGVGLMLKLLNIDVFYSISSRNLGYNHSITLGYRI